MVSRTLNRRALRDEHAPADRSPKAADVDASEDDEEGEEVATVRKPRAKKVAKVGSPKTPAKPRKKTPKTAPILFAQWAVCDGGLKRLALFDFKDRAGAEAKLASVQGQKKGPFVLQLVKDARADKPITPPFEECHANKSDR